MKILSTKYKINFFAPILFLLAFPFMMMAQVKIGDNPSLINSSSILELESNNKVLVLTRLSQSQINALVPLEGALVYNTDTQCIYAFDGTMWKNLCNEPNVTVSNTAPTINAIGDFWFNSLNNIANIWDGNQWLPINVNPRRGVGAPNATINNPIAGDIYVDQNSGDIYTYNGTNWISLNQGVTANNGLSITSNEIQLGGALITPTIITTSAVNTLAIEGLQNTILDDTKSMVVVDNTSGELSKVSASAIVQQEQIVIIASDGQTRFSPPITIADIDKIDVYRNGARIAFSLVNSTTIEVESEARCFDGDEIRIVQMK